MSTDTSEKGLESLIVAAMTGATSGSAERAAELPSTYGVKQWIQGKSTDYNRDYAIDLLQLTAFLRATQPKLVEIFGRVLDVLFFFKKPAEIEDEVHSIIYSHDFRTLALSKL